APCSLKRTLHVAASALPLLILCGSCDRADKSVDLFKRPPSVREHACERQRELVPRTRPPVPSQQARGPQARDSFLEDGPSDGFRVTHGVPHIRLATGVN